jgi:cytochrome P450
MNAEAVRKARAIGAGITRHVPSSTRALAEPPAGSGLKPVPGDQGVPLIGHAFEMLEDTLNFTRRRYAEFGAVSWSGGPGIPVVAVTGPDAIGEVLANREHVFLNGPGWNYFIGPFFRRGLMLMDLEEHLHHRRLMQQAFKHERLVGYQQAMNPAIARGLDGWGSQTEISLYPAAKTLTLDIATEVFMGGELGADADQLNRAFVDAVRGGQAFVRADMPGGTWHRGLEARKALERYFHQQLPAKRAAEGDDLLSVLCHAESEEGDRFSDEDVVCHMIFLLMAAHDTSTITLSMMAYYLGRHPEWQERLRGQSQALGTANPRREDLDSLVDLDHVMKETLRMNAPVGVLIREAVRDTSLQGYFIPAGSKLFLNVYASQRMQEWWSDPDRFDPERFSDERREDRSHQYAWIPFGGNVHKCIGMHFGSSEVKTILHQMLLRFRWSVPAGYEPPIEYGTGPMPGDGLPMRLERLKG